MSITTAVPIELTTLLAALERVEPDALTSCPRWTTHHAAEWLVCPQRFRQRRRLGISVTTTSDSQYQVKDGAGSLATIPEVGIETQLALLLGRAFTLADAEKANLVIESPSDARFGLLERG